MPNFGLLQEDCMAGLPEAASALSLNGTLVCNRVHQYIHYTVANTVAVIRGSYKGLPSTNTCQLTTCHRRCEAGTKAASSASIAHQYCTPVFNSYANLY